MSEYLEFTAKHTEEALAKASQHFGLPLNRLEWEVVEAGSAGLFGLIGGKKARVKVRPSAGSMAEEMAALAAVVNDQARPGAKDGRENQRAERKLEKPAASPAEAGAGMTGPSAPAAQAGPARQLARATEVVAAPERGPVPKPAAATPPPPPPAAEPEEEGEDVKASASMEEAEDPLAGEEGELVSGEDEEDEEGEGGAGEGRLEQDPVVIERSREVLARIIEPLDPQGRVEAKGGAGGIVLDIISREAGVLIGRRGQHLEALQYLVTRIVSHQAGKPVRISVDAGGYRQRRREALEEMALKVAEKAKATGKGISIGPLSAPERRVVHMALKNQPGITTSSRGRGELKKVMVSAR